MNRKQSKMLRHLSYNGVLGMSYRAAKRMFNTFDHETKGALRASYKADLARKPISSDEGIAAEVA